MTQPALASDRTDRLTRFATQVGRLMPDAMSTSVAMTLMVAIAALALGNSGGAVADAYYRGLWMLLQFTMQMTLILVLSTALGASPKFKTMIAVLARVPRTELSMYAMAIGITASLSYLYWGLGFALGPLSAVYLAREAERRGIALDFPFFLATTMAATSVWQFGLSSSAPLLMSSAGHFLEKTTGVMPLSTTIWTGASLTMIGGFLVAVLVTARFLKPKAPQPLSVFPEAYQLTDPVPDAAVVTNQVSEAPSERWERNPLMVWVLAAGLVGWLYYHFGVKKLGLDFNSLNTTLLLATLLVHGNVRNFSRALQAGIGSCWAIVVLYHLYAGVAGLLQFTSVGERFASALASVSNQYSFPFLVAATSAIVSMFVPSSGGQWAIQGFVTAKAAETIGVTAQRGLLAVQVGDQIGNLVTPFWAVIGAGMARIDFRRFIGYSIVYAVIWFVLGVAIFTVMPV